MSVDTDVAISHLDDAVACKMDAATGTLSQVLDALGNTDIDPKELAERLNAAQDRAQIASQAADRLARLFKRLGSLSPAAASTMGVLDIVCISTQRQKGNFSGSFNGVKWLGREITWYSEAKKCISPRAGSNSYHPNKKIKDLLDMQFRLQNVEFGFEVKQNPQAEACATKTCRFSSTSLRHLD